MIGGMTETTIPPIESATDPIGSPADLRERWRALMGTSGFGERLLWLGFVGADRRMYKTLTHVPIGREPSRGVALDIVLRLSDALAQFDAQAAQFDAQAGPEQGPTTVAMLLTRPGRDHAGAADRRWARVLTDTARRVGVAIEPIFLANDRSIAQL